MTQTGLWSWAARVLLLAAAYFVSGVVGMVIGYYHGGVVLMWPAAGVGLAALILYGIRLWPGIFLGVLLLSLVDPRVSTQVYAVIAAGDALEAVIGAFLLTRVAGFQLERGRVRDVATFLLIGVVGCTIIGPTFAMGSLVHSGLVVPDRFWPLWLVWWLGEATGVLAVAPVLLMAVHGSPPWRRMFRSRDFWMMLVVLLATTSVTFVASYPQPLGIILLLTGFPALVWAGRIGSRSATLASLIVIASATLATVLQTGPFAVRSELEEPLLLFGYSMVMGLTAFSLSAVFEQRRLANRMQRREENERRRVEKHQFLLRERGRLTREMHDGLGGQLVSLLSMVERGAGTRGEVAEALRRALDDIRIVIDSLDPSTTELPIALGKLRARLEAQLKRNDVELVWKVDDDPRLGRFSAEAVLHLLRIIQEGVANAIRRAGVTRVEVGVVSSPWRLHILIQDDGHGLEGRGMASMHARARQLETFLRITETERGTRIELRPAFPVSPSSPA